MKESTSHLTLTNMTYIQYSDHFVIWLAHSTLPAVIWVQGLLTQYQMCFLILSIYVCVTQYQKHAHCVFHTHGTHSCDTHTFTRHTHIHATHTHSSDVSICTYITRSTMGARFVNSVSKHRWALKRPSSRVYDLCASFRCARWCGRGRSGVCELVGASVYVWPWKVCCLSLSLPLFLSILSSWKLSFSQALLSLW